MAILSVTPLPTKSCSGKMPWSSSVDRSASAERLFASFLVCSIFTALVAAYGWQPPDPSVHWPGHSWIHFMKRLHVIMSIGAFLIEVCAMFFSLFALHRVLAGGFDPRAHSTAELLVRELEFEHVAVCSYFFAGALLVMGPVAIRCFCMVQMGIRSNSLAASVCCLIVGISMLILTFFNAHLASFPYDSIELVIYRFVELSLTRCVEGGAQSVITILAWTLQAVSVALALISIVETFPQYYYRELNVYASEISAAAVCAPAHENSVSSAAERQRAQTPDGIESEDALALGEIPPPGSTPEQTWRPLKDLPAKGGASLEPHLLGQASASAVGAGGHGANAGGKGTAHAPSPIPTADGIANGQPMLAHPAAGSAPAHAVPQQGLLHPWSLALFGHERPSIGAGGGLSAPIAGAPSARSHQRQRSGEVRFAVPERMAHVSTMSNVSAISKVSSVASSMQSLDSLAVD